MSGGRGEAKEVLGCDHDYCGEYAHAPISPELVAAVFSHSPQGLALLRDYGRWLKLHPLPPDTKPVTYQLRKQTLERDAYRCRFCGAWKNLVADHIIPRSIGGPAELWNLQTLCAPCNGRKGTNV